MKQKPPGKREQQLVWVKPGFSSLSRDREDVNLIPIITIDRSTQLEEKSLNICGWPELFSTEIIEKFEKETGIKVHIHTYATNKDMILTMKREKGTRYDIVTPSDYTRNLAH